tara:strand:+ start:13272 stop:14156 length:885 start_codon:yes stop_codon:yes gene_type:complete
MISLMTNSDYQQRTETILEQWLPQTNLEPKRLHESMRYSCLDGGKRIRPLLVYTTGSMFDVKLDALDGPAAAVEMIHCYSLIHDDLPAMDDDDLRRGKPTCHKAFDEATAILAGDALQALAFEVLAKYETHISADQRLKMIEILSEACGANGMAGGQAIDLYATGTKATIECVELMHRKKTGALIKASVCMGAIAAGCDAETFNTLEQFGECIGLAFQIQDDILDIEGNTKQLGKQQGADIALDKLTYPAVAGLQQAKQQADSLYQQAINLLSAHNLNAEHLITLAEYIVKRSH